MANKDWYTCPKHWVSWLKTDGEKCPVCELQAENKRLEDEIFTYNEELSDAWTENLRLREAYKQASIMAKALTSNQECNKCEDKHTFPSSACCGDCIFDSVYELAILMDEKSCEQALNPTENKDESGTEKGKS